MNPIRSRAAILSFCILLPVFLLSACGGAGEGSVITEPRSDISAPAPLSAEPEETEPVYHPAPITDLLTEETEPPVPDVLSFTDAPEDYFADALFIGDSRTVGLAEYAPLDGAEYFATVGMSVYSVMNTATEVGGRGNVTLETLLSSSSYGKIYLMLGINELGYGRNATVDRYGELVSYIREKQPEAILFLEANLHVTASRSAEDEIINNQEINDFNERISAFANGTDIFYIDINEAFDNAYGSLRSDYTFDDAHLRAEHYETWDAWLKTKAILK